MPEVGCLGSSKPRSIIGFSGIALRIGTAHTKGVERLDPWYPLPAQKNGLYFVLLPGEDAGMYDLSEL